MGDPYEQVRQILDSCTPEQRDRIARLVRTDYPTHEIERTWNTSAEVVLEALHRSGELTQRMFKGILAEAAFKVEVVDELPGWEEVTPPGDHAYDFLIAKDGLKVSIQVKLQRKVNHQPMRFKPKGRGTKTTSLYVTETQKSRKGQGKKGQSTRPYRFGEFDIIAVCVEPVTGDWTQFRYTVGDWLLPRPDNPEWLEIYQPVSLTPNDDWTDRLDIAIDWLRSGTTKTIRASDDVG